MKPYSMHQFATLICLRFQPATPVWRRILLAAALVALLGGGRSIETAHAAAAQLDNLDTPVNLDNKVNKDDESKVKAGVPAIVIPVELPLDSSREVRLLGALRAASARATGVERPQVVLEFKRAPQTSPSAEQELLGRGTPFERALSVARWLVSPEGSRIQTIAFTEESLAGHAVLIAIACEELALPLEAEFGQAGIDETNVDNTVKQAYLDVAQKRGNTFPAAAVASMVDPSQPLVRIDSLDGKSEYVTQPELARRERKAEEWKEEQLVPNNQMAWFRGQELRSWRWIAYSASDRQQLADALRLQAPLVEASVFQGPRTAMRIHLSGIVTSRHVDRTLRAIESGLADSKVNLVLLELDTPGGNLVESLRLAQYLADIPKDRAETACFIRNAARGDAALIALGCDELMLHPKAILGGPGEASLGAQQCNEYRPALEALSKSSGRSMGVLLGAICPDLPIYEYTSFDGRSQLNSPEWLQDDPVVPQWTRGKPIDLASGFNSESAIEHRITAKPYTSLDEIASHYGIDSLPPETRTNAAEQFVDWIASQVWLSFVLFFVGITALSAELSTPGIGFGGILAAICFGLFFWLRLLDGTVEWLEVLLMVGGVICLLIEIFVLPGFGVFGVTGLVLLGLGLILASQTFVWPTNEYQQTKMIQGFGWLGLVTFALLGTAFVFRKQIMNSPMVRWVALQPPTPRNEASEREQIEEELRTYLGWGGKTLSRCSPFGRALIGDKVWNVVSEEGWLDEDSDILVSEVKDQRLIVRKRT